MQGRGRHGALRPCPLMQHAVWEALAARGSASAAGPGGGEPDPAALADAMKRSFDRAPAETSLALLERLSELDRVHLLLALQKTMKRRTREQQDTQYVNDLHKGVLKHSQHANLTMGQIANAVEYQRVLKRMSSFSQSAPTLGQLSAVAVASGLPFVGFGFCDNLVMLLAGDAIDSLFGARLGLTTLASAGLGNIVADVVGVSVTQQIKERSRQLRWAQPPRLSSLQQAMAGVRAARIGGAALGVTLGCLFGMAPLAFMSPGFFVGQHPPKHPTAAPPPAPEPPPT